MRQLVGPTLFALVLWVGAFGMSFIVAEWREPDVSSEDIARIKGDLAGLQDDVTSLSHQIGIPAEPTVSPTPEPRTAPLTPGTRVASGAAFVAVAEVSNGRADFILEGPHPGAIGQDFKVTDENAFICEAGINAESGAPLGEGEKTRFWIVYTCAEGARAATLSLDSIRFEFPHS